MAVCFIAVVGLLSFDVSLKLDINSLNSRIPGFPVISSVFW